MEKPRRLPQEKALQFGANRQSSVTGNTDILVIGENVGSKKIDAAKKHSTRVITEIEYLELIASCSNDEASNTDSTGESTSTAAEDQMPLFA